MIIGLILALIAASVVLHVWLWKLQCAFWQHQNNTNMFNHDVRKRLDTDYEVRDEYYRRAQIERDLLRKRIEALYDHLGVRAEHVPEHNVPSFYVVKERDKKTEA